MVTEIGVAVAMDDASRRRDKGQGIWQRRKLRRRKRQKLNNLSSTATSMWSVVAVGSLQRQHCLGHMHNPTRDKLK